MVTSLTGSPKVAVASGDSTDAICDPVEIDFTPPFRRISIVDTLKAAIHPMTLPDLNTNGKDRFVWLSMNSNRVCVLCVCCVILWHPTASLLSVSLKKKKHTHTHTKQDSVGELLEICKRFGVDAPRPHTAARLVDKLIGHFIEPQLVQPTFLCDHPMIMSPLAKQHPKEVTHLLTTTIFNIAVEFKLNSHTYITTYYCFDVLVSRRARRLVLSCL